MAGRPLALPAAVLTLIFLSGCTAPDPIVISDVATVPFGQNAYREFQVFVDGAEVTVNATSDEAFWSAIVHEPHARMPYHATWARQGGLQVQTTTYLPAGNYTLRLYCADAGSCDVNYTLTIGPPRAHSRATPCWTAPLDSPAAAASVPAWSPPGARPNGSSAFLAWRDDPDNPWGWDDDVSMEAWPGMVGFLSHDFSVTFRLPERCARIAPGLYQGLGGAASGDRFGGGLTLSVGGAAACDNADATVAVDAADYDHEGALRHIELRFEVMCTRNPHVGAIVWDASDAWSGPPDHSHPEH